MGKDVTIEAPCAHMVIQGKAPDDGHKETATIHLVPVPSEALTEVQEILKKYQPQMEKFNEILKKAMESQRE